MRPQKIILCLIAWFCLVTGLTQPAAERARKLTDEGRWQEAEQAWREQEQKGGLAPQDLDPAVQASTRLNHWDRVAEILNHFRTRHPLTVAQRVTLYESLLRAGRKEDAEKELNLLVSDRPRDERLTHLLAFLYLSQQRYPDAVQTYLNFLKHVPEAIESRINLALIWFKLGQGQSALEQISAAFQQDFEEANRYFYRQLVRNMPVEGLASLAEDVKRELGLPLDGARAHLYLAREYDNLSRYDPAIEHYERYLQTGGRNPEAELALAKLYFRVGRDEDSEKLLEPLTAARGETGDQARLLAAELAIRSSRFGRASELLEKLPPSYHQQPLYQYFSARIALHRGQDEEARRLLEQVIDTDPTLAEAYFHLAQIHLRNGEIEEGRRLMAEFQKRQQ